MSLRNDYGFSWIDLPGSWIHNQDYEYYACSVHLLYIQLVTKQYTCGFPAPGCKCTCTLSLWAHLWSSCLGNASQLYANKSYLNTPVRPTQPCCFHSLGVYTNPPPPDTPFLLTLNQSPKDIGGSGITNCLTHTCYSCMTVMQDIGSLSWY